MKVVDPQSALLTNAEVYDFLKSSKPRTADKKIGAYEPVDLKGYKEVRKEVQSYVEETAPLTASFPPPQSYMVEVVKRLRQLGLTKTEVFSIINLGIGLPRPEPAVNGEAEGMEVDEQGEAAADDNEHEPVAHIAVEEGGVGADDIVEEDSGGRQLLQVVVDSLDERFPGDEGEETIQAVLKVLRDCINLPTANAMNGTEEPADTT